MTPGGGSLWLVAWLMVMWLAAQPISGCQVQICQNHCCIAKPSCTDAQHITCDCPNTELENDTQNYRRYCMVGGRLHLKREAVPHKFACQPRRIKDSRERATSIRRSQAVHLEAALAVHHEMELTNGNIPTSVETLSFSQMNSLTIGKDAFYNLHALRNVTLHHIPTVMAEGGGLNMPLGNVLYYFNAISIDDLFIDSQSAIGYWEEKTDVTFKDIKILKIESKGLHYATSERGPRIAMQNVAALQLATQALSAPIRILKLENTSMHDCHRETFVSKIDLIELNNVTIRNVKMLCFRSVGEHRQIAMEEHGLIAMDSGVRISSSKLGTVHPQAFSGNMPTLKLTRTEIGTIAKQGFQTNVKKFRLTESDIDTLSSEALSVTCERKLVIKEVKIASLAKNAFMGIADSLWPTGVPSNSLMNGTLNSSCEFELRNVAVENAAVGSLQMPRCLFVSDVRDPDIKSNVIDQCPKKRWARLLLGITDLRPMFTNEVKLFDRLIDSDPRCDDEYDRKLDERIDDPKCFAPDEKRLKPREGEDAEYGTTPKGEGASDEQDNVPAPKPTELSEDTGANGGGSDTGAGATSVWQHPVWMVLTFVLIGVVVVMVVIGGLYVYRRMRHGDGAFKFRRP